MRELQSDDLNVESLRRFGISDREMRFVQVHATNLHPLQVRAQLLRTRHYSRAYSSCGSDHRNRDGDRRSYTAQTSFGKRSSSVQSNATRIFLSKPGNLLR